MLINVIAKSKNIDTEFVGKMLTDICFPSITALATPCLLAVTKHNHKKVCCQTSEHFFKVRERLWALLNIEKVQNDMMCFLY